MGAATAAALKRWRESGRKLLLTTGENPEQLARFPHLELFNLVIAENGALLYNPASKREHRLAAKPPAKLLRALRNAKIRPLHQGRVILATKYSQEKAVVRVLSELGIDWQIQRNRRQLMILPTSVNQATGLAAALHKLRLSPHVVLGVGDAENDLPLIAECGKGAAVANAVPSLKRHAQIVTKRGVGQGVVELIKKICANRPPRGKKKPNAKH